MYLVLFILFYLFIDHCVMYVRLYGPIMKIRFEFRYCNNNDTIFMGPSHKKNPSD